ncbi:MAG TPA: nucleotidyltransferase family protein, partial [Candidatus Bathyarchaeota archaeon]|nr:nucleotidyltransferase family protein [Candidatus Bathyarchaeota archaeon]
DDGRIIGFQEKPRLKKPVSIGILTLEGDSLKEIEDLKEGKTQLDIMGEVVPYLIRRGKRVYGYLTDAFWYDVGSIEAYEKLDVELVDKLFSYLFDD